MRTMVNHYERKGIGITYIWETAYWSYSSKLYVTSDRLFHTAFFISTLTGGVVIPYGY